MKKFLSLLLSLCLITSLTAQAFAASSDVSFESDVAAPDILDVIVPAEIPIHMSQTGDVQIAQTLEILNKSSRPVEILNIQVDGKNDWNVREFDYDFSSIPVDTKDLALSFRGDKTDATGNVVLSADNWHIDVGSELNIQTDAKLPLQTQASKSSIATVIWTIDFADDMPENPDDDIVIKVLPGDHGYCDVDVIKPDSDGRVMSYPDVNTNTGYDCTGFVNADDLSPVNSDTVYTQNTSIRPVFELKPGWIRVPVDTSIPGVSFVPNKDPEILIDPDGTVQVVPGVKPDEGFESDGFIDNNTGNPVTPGVNIDISIDINITINVNKIETPEQPEQPDKTVTVPVLPGENGDSDEDSITTDKNGKIPVFPSVTPDEGFKFDHWEDQNGNPVDENTEFKPGDQIKPVCKPDPDYQPEQPEDPDKTITVPVLPGENGNSDEDSVVTDKNGKIPVFPSVTPDEGFKFDHWEDQNGNPVDSDTEFKPGDQIKPVCKPDPDYQPDLTVTVLVVPGDHGSASVGSVTTDRNGRIPTYPPVMADAGYLFDKFVDADGNPVDENTVFSQGSVIKPVFVVDPDYNTIRLPILPGKNGNSVADYVDTDSSGRVPEFPEVIPDDGYEFTRWRDRAGTTITTETVFTEPREIYPVCTEIAYQDFTITAENRDKIGFTGEANEELVIPERFYDEETGTYYKTVAIAARAFIRTDNLTSVIIPDSVSTIGEYAFYLSGIQSVQLPRNLRVISEGLFHSSNLKSIDIPSSVRTIDDSAFSVSELESVTIPNSVTSINESAFSYTKITSVIIPNSVTTMGESAFAGCARLTNAILSNNCQTVPEFCFFNCKALTFVIIPYGVRTLDNGCFQKCDFRSVTTPNSLRTIGNVVFLGNNNLTSVKLCSGLKTIGSTPFSECAISVLRVPKTVTSTGANAFHDVGKVEYF